MLWILVWPPGLAKVYGDAGSAQIQQKLGEFASTTSGAEIHLLGVNLPSVDAPTLYSDLKSLARGTAGLTSLLIVGDQRAFPTFSIANPVSDRSIDPDTSVETDNPYGMFDWTVPSDATVPSIPVGRILLGTEQNATALCALLDQKIRMRTAPATKTGYVEIVSRQWQLSSSSVLAITAPAARLVVSPDGRVSAGNASSLDCKYLYCNLHGFPDSAAWCGYDDGLRYPVPAVTPDAFQLQYVSGTAVLTEACYGLATNGKSTGQSNALSLLAAGAAAVIGATGLAYGTSTIKPNDLIDADLLARTFFNFAQAGASVGDCLNRARNALRSSSSASDPYLSKTLLQFQLLGDPSYELS